MDRKFTIIGVWYSIILSEIKLNDNQIIAINSLKYFVLERCLGWRCCFSTFFPKLFALESNPDCLIVDRHGNHK